MFSLYIQKLPAIHLFIFTDLLLTLIYRLYSSDLCFNSYDFRYISVGMPRSLLASDLTDLSNNYTSELGGSDTLRGQLLSCDENGTEISCTGMMSKVTRNTNDFLRPFKKTRVEKHTGSSSNATNVNCMNYGHLGVHPEPHLVGLPTVYETEEIVCHCESTSQNPP